MASIVLALATLPAAGAALAQVQGQEIVVQGEAARAEIERILEADNLDADRLSPREIVEIMEGIERGGAPEDFWNAYQIHLQAWQRYAGAVDQVQRQPVETSFGEGFEALVEAEEAIGTTFDEVERIARRYGARLPVPPADLRSIA